MCRTKRNVVLFTGVWFIIYTPRIILPFDFSLPKDYDKEKPPQANNGSVEISVRLLINRIQDIDMENDMYSLDMWAYYKWREDRLLITGNISYPSYVHLNLKQGSVLWKPNVHLWDMTQLVLRKGLRDLGRFTIWNDKTVLYVIAVSVRTSCQFDFDMYPFDHQCCSSELVSYPDPYPAVKLKWGIENKLVGFTSNYYTERRTPKYVTNVFVIKEPLLKKTVSVNMSAVAFSLSMRRQIMSHILKVYLPTGIFVVMSWGSFLIKPEVVPGRMVLLVTTLLTLITMLESITSNAPPSLNVQAITLWMLVSVFFVVLALLEYACLLFKLRTKVDKEQQSRTYQSRTKSLLSGSSTKTTCSETNMIENMKKCYAVCMTRLSKPFPCFISSLFSPDDKWNMLDKASLLLFPIAFIIYNLYYWCCFVNSYNDQISKGCV